MTVTFTTDLPDATAPALGNGVEDEIAVDVDDVINYGFYRVQARESGETAWDSSATGWAEQTFSSDGDLSGTESDIVTGREDGEGYEVRVRSETEHVTGAWTSPVSIVTKFPGATGFSKSNVDKFGADFDWTDNADNEDGFRLERRRLYDSGWGPWRELDDLPPDTESAADSSALPGKDYEYRVVPYTEHTEAPSTAVSVETVGTGLNEQRIPASGYYVEVQVPDSGNWLSPDLVADPEQLPVVNGLPKFEIPVPKDDKWDGFDGAKARVWVDGRRLPIDELDAIEQQPDRTVLRLVGGTELRKRVTTDVVEQEAHLKAKDLIANESPYTPNVDSPATTAEEDVLQQNANSDGEFSNLVSIPVDQPAEIRNGNIEHLQSGWFLEAENGSQLGSAGFRSDSVSSNGEFVELSGIDDGIEMSFTTDYVIPASAVAVSLRYRIPVDTDDDGFYESPRFQIYIDDNLVHDRSKGDFSYNDYTWSTFSGDWSSGDLAAGSHTVKVVTPGTSGTFNGEMDLDAIFPEDSRASRNYDNSVDANGYLSGPEEVARNTEIVFNAAAPTKSVVGAWIDTTWDDTSGAQALSLSIDSGATWDTANNTSSFRKDYSDTYPSVTARVSLGRYGSRSDASPTTGFKGQKLQSYKLYADLEDIPILVNKGYDDLIVNVLKEIADYGNYVFEVQYDPDVGYTVEWTQPGQRPADQRLEEIIDYDVERDTGTRVEKAIVFGARRPIDGETFTSNHDTEVQLAHFPIVEASETVRDGNGTVFERGADYIMRNQSGTIEVLSTGSMADATDYQIDYSYKISNSYTASGVTDPKPRRFDLQSIPTERGCGQAALYLVQKLQDTVISAEVVVPKLPPSLSVINAIDPELLGVGEQMQIRDVSQTSEKAVIALESRQSVGDVVSDLENRLTSVARRV